MFPKKLDSMFKLGPDGKGDTWCLVKGHKGHILTIKVLKRMAKQKKIVKDYFRFLLHSLFHDYNGLVYDYN